MYQRMSGRLKQTLNSVSYDFSVKIGQLLEQKGMTQENLTEQTGITAGTISNIVNNQRSVINN